MKGKGLWLKQKVHITPQVREFTLELIIYNIASRDSRDALARVFLNMFVPLHWPQNIYLITYKTSCSN